MSWAGGTYLDPTGRDDVRGFRIYGSDAPGGPVDYATPLDTVAAYPGGWVSDGFGMGGFGSGGFGRAATTYQWQSDPLAPGVWQFAVVSVRRRRQCPGLRPGRDRGDRPGPAAARRCRRRHPALLPVRRALPPGS